MPSILQVCESYVGIKEKPARSNRTILGARYGENGVPWCGISVCMAYRDAGMDLRKVLTPYMASTVAIQAAAKKKGWYKDKRLAKPTDIVCYHMNGGRSGINHVGIVKSVDANGVWAYEGNTSQAGSQYAGGAYLVKYRPWSLILGVIKIPYATQLGGGSPAPAPAPAPPTRTLPVRQGLVVFSTGRLVEIAQWELAAISQARFAAEEMASPDHPAIYGGSMKQAVYDLGKFYGKNWDGNWIGPDQWALIDFLYLSRGHEPVVR